MKSLVIIAMVLLILSPAQAEGTASGRNPVVSDRDSRVEEYLKSGYEYIKSEQYQEAVKDFKSAIRLAPENADAYVGLSISYVRLGDNEAVTFPEIVQKAVDASLEAIARGTNCPEIHLTLGLSYLALNDKELAINEYEILEPLNAELANILHAKIEEYKPPAFAVKIRESGTRWYGVPSSASSHEPERNSAPTYAQPTMAECEKRMDKLISFPKGTTRMSTRVREAAERRYEQRKAKFFSECMGMDVTTPAAPASTEVDTSPVYTISAPPKGAIDVRTGEYYPPAAGGVIDPKTGTFYQDVGGGYVNTRTGEFMPKIGGQ